MTTTIYEYSMGTPIDEPTHRDPYHEEPTDAVTMPTGEIIPETVCIHGCGHCGAIAKTREALAEVSCKHYPDEGSFGAFSDMVDKRDETPTMRRKEIINGHYPSEGSFGAFSDQEYEEVEVDGGPDSHTKYNEGI